MILTALLAQTHYISAKKATSYTCSLGLDEVVVEAVVDGEIVRDVIPVEDPHFVVEPRLRRRHAG